MQRTKKQSQTRLRREKGEHVVNGSHKQTKGKCAWTSGFKHLPDLLLLSLVFSAHLQCLGQASPQAWNHGGQRARHSLKQKSENVPQKLQLETPSRDSGRPRLDNMIIIGPITIRKKVLWIELCTQKPLFKS